MTGAFINFMSFFSSALRRIPSKHAFKSGSQLWSWLRKELRARQAIRPPRRRKRYYRGRRRSLSGKVHKGNIRRRN